MKFKATLALALFLHLLVHPLVHGGSFSPSPTQHATVSAPKANPQAARPIDDCAVCRSVNALAGPSLSADAAHLNSSRHLPVAQDTAATAGSHITLPARAPPAL
ncbi:MAG TPA: hypothetical protein VG892_04740 [Terriglobales bacterium]|nr:hypothetical protein [Terriglobales bacterium]